MKKLKKMKMSLCLVLALTMVFGGMQVWAGVPASDNGNGQEIEKSLSEENVELENMNVSAGMVAVEWHGYGAGWASSIDEKPYKIVAINGKAVDRPEDLVDREYPVGTTFTLKAEDSLSSDLAFSRWSALVADRDNPDSYGSISVRDCLSSEYSSETILTITEEMDGKYLMVSPEYRYPEAVGKVCIAPAYTTEILDQTGDIYVDNEHKVLYPIEGGYASDYFYGAGSQITFQVKDPEPGASYGWFLYNGLLSPMAAGLYKYFPGEHDSTFTLEVTQEMINTNTVELAVYAVKLSKNSTCGVYVQENMKILSADGAPVEITEKGSLSFGNFAPGTVLEIESEEGTASWFHGSLISFAPEAESDFYNSQYPYGLNFNGDVWYFPDKGQLTVLSDNKIQYVVPDRENVVISTQEFPDRLQFIDIDKLEAEAVKPPETTDPEPETTPPETTPPETTVPDATPERVEQVQNFVQQLYVNILQRSSDQTGLTEWADVLLSGKESGAKVAQGFVDSDEFKARNLSDEEYIKVLYRAFLGREADQGGLNAWINVLDSGLSRMHVFKGFAESNEFTAICQNYGIIRGNAVLTAPMDQNEGVTKFVARCYNLCLGRKADTDGINAWCNQILTGANTAKQAAYGFVFSDEFKGKNLSDEEYVRTLYRVFMDREADGAGLDAWLNVLAGGQSREHVFNGFADSPEFREICAGYGIS